jgi:uncharacterized protein (DUF1330 family)
MTLSAKLAGSVLLGMTVGGAVTQAIHAQARPPAFAVVEIDVSNPDGFQKEYSPNAGKIMDAAGGKYLTRGPSRKVSIDGEPVKPTTVIIQFESLEKARRSSARPSTASIGRSETNTPNSASGWQKARHSSEIEAAVSHTREDSRQDGDERTASRPAILPPRMLCHDGTLNAA